MVLQIINIILPLLVVILLGFVANRKQWFDMGTLQGIKSIIGGILLPVVLFNAFFTADYSSKTVITFVVVYAVLCAAIGIGFLLRGLVPGFGKYMPTLLCGFEGGMLGYALFGLLFPGETSYFAMADVGQTVFSFTVLLSSLKIMNGEKPSAKMVLHGMMTSQPCVGMLLGILLGAAGLGKAVQASSIGATYSALVSFITAPTSFLVLLMVGYELSFKKEIMSPAIRTMLLRLVVMGGMCAVGSLVIFSLVPFDKKLLVAMMLGFTLPAPFIIPIYAETGDKNQKEYISTTLSLSSLLFVACYVGIAIYALA